MQQLILLDPNEHARRIESVRRQMKSAGASALLVTDNANTYYLTGRVFMGWTYIPAEGEPRFFVRRPVALEGEGVIYVRKPEQIADFISTADTAAIALELDVTPYNTVMRLAAIFPESKIINGSPMMRAARAVKTPCELDLLRESGRKQSLAYSRIATLYTPGMTDIELQVEIEHALRREGNLGQFRISGDSMELFMGSILVGDNADNPTPYDFAMGGAGMDGSIPAGANGTKIYPGNSVMIDMNGNFNGYMTDMTRTFAPAPVSDLAMRAHQCSIDICHTIASMAIPGAKAKDLYEKACAMALEAGLQDYFMGHRQKAGFIGHGVGIEINELPVIAPKSRDTLSEGNVIALEPKFVIPGVGAVGIENTYVVTETGAEPLVDSPEQIQYFHA